MEILSSDSDRRRIGVAVPIPEPVGTYLQEARQSFGDAMAPFIPSHVTLAPPTVVAVADLPGIEAHLAAVAAAHGPFVVELSGTGSFRPISPVVFINLAEGGPNCAALEADVRSGPLAQELRFPYHPHVTVAHDIDDDGLDLAEQRMAGFWARFVIDSFSLFEHGDDGVWRPARDLPLTGGEPVTIERPA